MNRVLIVDDEEMVREVISKQIREIGFTPVTASSAQKALELFHMSRFGIVLSDLNLNGSMDGVALCSRINYEDRSVIMIAMSGFFSEYDKIWTLSAGFSDFLTKPIQIDELSSALQCAFDRRSRWAKLL